jgi:hypothetical protein
MNFAIANESNKSIVDLDRENNGLPDLIVKYKIKLSGPPEPDIQYLRISIYNIGTEILLDNIYITLKIEYKPILEEKQTSYPIWRLSKSLEPGEHVDCYGIFSSKNAWSLMKPITVTVDPVDFDLEKAWVLSYPHEEVPDLYIDPDYGVIRESDEYNNVCYKEKKNILKELYEPMQVLKFQHILAKLMLILQLD